jgi:hypothetical protein
MKKWQWSMLVLATVASRTRSQDVSPRYVVQPAPVYAPPQTSTFGLSVFNAEFSAGSQGDPLAGNRNFPNFIRWIFGQFYVAVVVAQTVGLKLAQPTNRSDANAV